MTANSESGTRPTSNVVTLAQACASSSSSGMASPGVDGIRSWLSEAEWADAFERFGVLDPLAYANVTDTQLSVARHFGGASVNSRAFYYIPETDELVRSDVFKWVHKRRADAAIALRNAQAVDAAVRQGVLHLQPAGSQNNHGKT